MICGDLCVPIHCAVPPSHAVGSRLADLETMSLRGIYQVLSVEYSSPFSLLRPHGWPHEFHLLLQSPRCTGRTERSILILRGHRALSILRGPFLMSRTLVQA